MKKKYVAFISDSNDIRNDYLIYEAFWNNISKKFTKFYFINLNYIINKKNNFKDKNYIKKFFPKNLIIFRPKSYFELESFLKERQIIVFNGLGRDIKYFYTLYILKKFNCKILLNLTIGYTGQGNNFYFDKNNKIKNFLKYLKFIYLKKIVYFLFRFLVLINIFPKIDILFEGSKNNVKIYKNYITHKIKKKIPWLDITYVKEIKHVNFRSYEELVKKIPHLEDKYIVFLDSNFDHGDAVKFQGEQSADSRKKYYFYLKKVLNKISNLYKKKIVICLHPNTNTQNFKKHININKNVKIVKYKTSYYITKADLVLFHESSIILDAIFLRKKIINLRSSLMGKYFVNSNKKYSKLVKIPYINLNNYEHIDKNYINKFFKNKKNLYQSYLKNFLTFNINDIENLNDKNLNGSEQIISTIKKKYFDS